MEEETFNGVSHIQFLLFMIDTKEIWQCETEQKKPL